MNKPGAPGSRPAGREEAKMPNRALGGRNAPAQVPNQDIRANRVVTNTKPKPTNPPRGVLGNTGNYMVDG